MCVLLDANVLVSGLLGLVHPARTVSRIIAARLARTYLLLLPAEVLDEAMYTVATEPYFTARVTLAEAEAFAAAPAAIGRGARDDYLLAHARAGRADYLVTGDKDLLALADDDFPFQIVSPAQFLAVLEDAGVV